MQVVLVVNPKARRMTDAALEATTRIWGADHELTVVPTPPRDRPEELAGPVAGADVVAVLSGDGTVNQVANVLADLRSDATLVPLPAGATNVVARSIGLPRDLGAANRIALGALADGRTGRVGWGRLDGQGFLCNAGVGLDALVVQRVETDPARKRRWGHLWFAAAAVRTLGDARTTRLRCEGCGGDPPVEAWWVVALARTPYSYAGPVPIDLVPARTGTGTGQADAPGLWLLRLEPVALPHLVGLAGRALLGHGGIVGRPGMRGTLVAGPVTCRSDLPVPAQIDGEPLPAATSFTFDWQPDALRLLGPLPPGAAHPAGRRRRPGPFRRASPEGRARRRGRR